MYISLILPRDPLSTSARRFIPARVSLASTLQDSQGTASPSDYEAVQKVAMMAMAIYNVQISFAPADQGRAWNFQISGVYQQVMLARGMIMKESPVQVRSPLSIFSCCSEWYPFTTLVDIEPRRHQSRSFRHPRIAFVEAKPQNRSPSPSRRDRFVYVRPHCRSEQYRFPLDALVAGWRQ